MQIHYQKRTEKRNACDNLIRDSSQSFCSTPRKNKPNPCSVVVATFASDVNTITAVPIIPPNSTVVSLPSNLQKLKINKFQTNQQYLYEKHLDSKKIILKLHDRFFYCRLPKYMYKTTINVKYV